MKFFISKKKRDLTLYTLFIILFSVSQPFKLDEFPYSTEAAFPIYSSIGTNENGDLFIESSSGKPYSKKSIISLKENGREYIDGIQKQVMNSKSNLYSTYGDVAIITINDHKCYLKISYNESIEMYDFDDKKYTSAKTEDILGYKVESYHNSLLRTKEENTFIYSYITTDNYLIMQKFKVVSNDASNCIQLNKTTKETVKTYSKRFKKMYDY